MSTHYNSIPVESDNEDNNVTEATPMVEDDSRIERTRSTDRSNFFHNHDTDTDDDPDEDPPTTDNREPLLTSNSEVRPFGQRPFRQTARIRAATPSSQQWTQTQSSIPPPTHGASTTPGFHIWERTLRTLKRWRDHQQYTPPAQMDGSTSIRQEFLLDTTPIIVDKLVRQEEKLDILEDIVMDLPAAENLGEMQYQLDNTDGNVSYVNDEVQALKKKVEELTAQIKRMDRSVERMENQMFDCHTMTAMALGTTQDNLRMFFEKDKGKKIEGSED